MIYLSRTFFLHRIIPFDFERDLNKRNKNRFSSRSPEKNRSPIKIGPRTADDKECRADCGRERNRTELASQKYESRSLFPRESSCLRSRWSLWTNQISLSLSLLLFSDETRVTVFHLKTYIENANYRIGCAELATISISQLRRCATIRKDLFQRSNSRIRRQCVNQIKHNLILLTLFRNVACTWVIWLYGCSNKPNPKRKNHFHFFITRL